MNISSILRYEQNKPQESKGNCTFLQCGNAQIYYVYLSLVAGNL